MTSRLSAEVRRGTSRRTGGRNNEAILCRVLLSRHSQVACNLHCVTRSSLLFSAMACVRSVLFCDGDQINKEEEEEEYPPEVLTLRRVVL